ncbi:sugar phosphate isomerase/epimerase family protein [Cohnella rhizosphaerae]|uniref:Sugar phosphate isomerase/epimerase n=1 Tax=Cohnella rhizosphaerae TaxID=1457232 RepID=A0A9X4QV77_9BACL|nr:TIM barrel protein [Cohnella rhizosphaerae]MDG0812143.1 sugar phosphate isomerase/epimerase [Cohnella rhizosphaerae]
MTGSNGGGDVHVLPGELRHARDVRAMTEAAGLQVPSYGSYYRAGGGDDFNIVLDTAEALGAPNVRIWAGSVGSAEADEAMRISIAEEIRRIAELSKRRGIGLSLEFHDGTLADTETSSVSLIRSIASDNVSLYWQPRIAVSPQSNLSTLAAFLPWLSNVHVFHYDMQRMHRPLEAGEAEWRAYVDALKRSGKPRYALLEFVKDGEAEQFLKDARTLKKISWIRQRDRVGSLAARVFAGSR